MKMNPMDPLCAPAASWCTNGRGRCAAVEQGVYGDNHGINVGHCDGTASPSIPTADVDRTKGVGVTVTGGEDVKIRSSVTDNVVKEGGQVTLTCTSVCSFHQFDVHCGQKPLRLGVCWWGNMKMERCGEDEDGEDVKVRSSVTDNVVKEGGQVTLTCTSACSFHQLNFHWYRNGNALSETGPALHLSSLTNDEAGNYTCSLYPVGRNPRLGVYWWGKMKVSPSVLLMTRGSQTIWGRGPPHRAEFISRTPT
ncbi:unnamed protein product [Boreogadus saida]